MKQKIIGHIHLLAHALRRVGNEFFDIAQEQKGAEMKTYDVLLYIRPVSKAEGKELVEAISRDLRVEVPTDKLPTPTWDMTFAFYIQALCPSADAALSRSLDVLRTSLREVQLNPTSIKAEIEAGVEGVTP